MGKCPDRRLPAGAPKGNHACHCHTATSGREHAHDCPTPQQRRRERKSTTFEILRLQLVVVVADIRHLDLDTLALTHISDDLTGQGSVVKRRATLENLPMVEDQLREGLTSSVGAEIGGETEGLVDGQVSLDVEEGSTDTLVLLEDVTSPAGKDTVDTTHGLLGHLDLDQVDGLLESGLGEQSSSVQHTTSSGDDLTTTTVNSISVESDIHDVEADGTHGLLSNGTLLGGPLETGDDRVLDFVEVLDGLGLVDKQVGTGGVGTEAPNLTGIGDIPAVLVSENTGTGLQIVTGSDLAGLDSLGDLLVKGLSSHVDTVVLVGRLGQSSHARDAVNGLTVLDNGVGDTERNTSVVLLEILQADLQVELTGTGNNVLTGVGDVSQDTRVGLGETLKTLNELGKILGVLDLDGTLHDGGDGELHNLEVVGSLVGGEGTRLEQELVNTDKTKNVTSGNIVDGLDETAHHEDGTLDGLDEQVLLLARDVVGTLDADLKTGLDSSGEDTTEGVETALVGGGNHLGDVQHEGTLGVTVPDTDGVDIVVGTLVQGLHAVLLGGGGRRKVENHHLEQSVGSGKELAHHNLEELLALEVLLVAGELDLKLLEESGDLVGLEVHDSGEDAEDGVQDELVESTLKGLTLVCANLGPFLGLGVEERVTPQALAHLVLVNTELLGVPAGELADGESPSVQTGTEGDGTLLGVDLDITEALVVVGGNDDVDRLNDTGEVLVQVLLGDLELEKSTIDLVDDNNGLDALTESLTQDGLGLDAHTLDGVDDDKGTVGDTESGSDFGGEINVTRRVDQVDQELVLLGLDGDVLEVILVGEGGEQGDGGRLDGDTTLLLVGTGIGETGGTSVGGRNDTSTLDERVGKGGLAVIDCERGRSAIGPSLCFN
jgi:hypothetical protein